MSELYGAPSGFIAASNEAHTDAMTQLGLANAQQVQAAAARDQQMFALLSAPGVNSDKPATPDELIQRIEGQANTLLKSGFAVQGDKMAQTASTMRWNQAKIANDERLAKKTERQDQLEAMQELDGLLATVHSQSDLDQAIATHQAQDPNTPIPDQFKTYDQGKFDQIRQGTKAGIASLKVQMELDKQADMAEKRAVDLERKQDWLDLQEKRLELSKQTAANRAKTAGPKSKEVGQPTKDMINMAQSMLRDEYPDLVGDLTLGKDIVSKGSYAVASRAKGLMATVPGLTSEEALTRAMEEEKPNFQTIAEEPGFMGTPFGGKPAKTTYKVGGKATSTSGGPKPGAPGSQTNPLPALTDPKQAKEGMWYNSSKYGIGQVRGGKFIYSEQ